MDRLLEFIGIFLFESIMEKSLSIKEPVQLVWEGNLFARYSFSHVNRELGLALLRRRELDVTFVPYERDQFDGTSIARFAPLVSALAANKRTSTESGPGRPRIWVRHQHPFRPLRPPNSTWIIFRPWEYSRFPERAVQVLNLAREVWTTSRFSQESMIRSGVPAENTQVIPNGVNLEIFRPEGLQAELPTSRPFRFLYVGATIHRKGIDILLQAYGRAFTSADPVALVIKDLAEDHVSRGQTNENLIHQFSQNPNHPEIVYLSDYRTNAEMAALYRACDVFVSSYRGEGFCLPALEAMACGRPVIVTQGGSTDDFVASSSGWQIPAGLCSLGDSIEGMPVNGEAHLLEPDADALVQLLREAFRDESGCLSRGAAAAREAQNWSWDHAAEKVVARCRNLVFKTDSKQAQGAF
jgi:glycosyltransferase involved in cell wall biosynthesis